MAMEDGRRSDWSRVRLAFADLGEFGASVGGKVDALQKAKRLVPGDDGVLTDGLGGGGFRHGLGQNGVNTRRQTSVVNQREGSQLRCGTCLDAYILVSTSAWSLLPDPEDALLRLGRDLSDCSCSRANVVRRRPKYAVLVSRTQG